MSGRVSYGAAHKALRAQWAVKVDAGDGWCMADRCLYASRWIPPGSDWDLGHAPDGRHRGPEHRKCNQTGGASMGGKLTGKRNLQRLNRVRRGIPPARTWQPSRHW